MRTPAAKALVLACLIFDPTRTQAAASGGMREFDSGRICIARAGEPEPLVLKVEFADTEPQHARGLMDRASLSADAGMLFRYGAAQPPTTGFWMQRVSFPLDIAFLDAAGHILSIQTMPPCPNAPHGPCPIYPAGMSFHSALEVNGGYFAAQSIRPGSAVTPCDSSASETGTVNRPH